MTSKTHEKSPVIITSLSVCYELWLIVERKYIRCTALVELYTFIKSKFDKTLVCLLKSYFYLLILRAGKDVIPSSERSSDFVKVTSVGPSTSLQVKAETTSGASRAWVAHNATSATFHVAGGEVV